MLALKLDEVANRLDRVGQMLDHESGHQFFSYEFRIRSVDLEHQTVNKLNLKPDKK
jgi:hypothetical protein